MHRWSLLMVCLAACGDGAGPDLADSGSEIQTDTVPEPVCVIPGDPPPFTTALGCAADFEALASDPLDASIPAARSLKTVYDRITDTLYFQDANRFPTHYPFCVEHLSGGGLPIVGDAVTFNQREYYSPDRRFLLGSLTRYAGPDVYTYELAPYDTASPEMIATAFDAIVANAWFAEALRFHPTSQAQERLTLRDDIGRIRTDELFQGIAYQPLNLATAMGRLRFLRAAEIDSVTLDFRDLVVLDFVPNDIGVVQGIITSELQTPLAHINVLSQNRQTPNMTLLGAWSDEALRALDGRWVELTVGAFDWSIREVTAEEADAWWEAHRPPPLGIPARDLSVTALADTATLLDGELAPALQAAIPAFGGKAAHYAALTRIPELRVERAFAIPITRYVQHLERSGLDREIEAFLADPEVFADPVARRQRLSELRDAIIAAPIDEALVTAVTDALSTLSRRRARFRSSTNAEDLDGFTGAGLYRSVTGDPDDPDARIDRAIKTVWASVWREKAFVEREYRGIDHRAVGMGILVSPSFAAEEANGVAITANLFDPAGIEPGFVIDVQRGGISVVLPPPGVVSDFFVYYFYYPGQPASFLSHSNLVAPDRTVLTTGQTFALGQALDRIHAVFAPVYRRPDRFYGMDVEFKLDRRPGEEPLLYIKQVRPHPGWGL